MIQYKLIQRGFTLIELLMVIILSVLILSVGIMYIQGVYRAQFINQAEKMILQVITASKDYYSTRMPTGGSSNPNDPSTMYRQYDGISTLWVVRTGQIPYKFITSGGIATPWSDEPSIAVRGGSEGLGGRDDAYIDIVATHLPEYACRTLAKRLLAELGTQRTQGNRIPTYTECRVAEDPDDGPYVLEITTNPQFY